MDLFPAVNVLRSKHVPVGTDAAGSLVALLSLLAPAASPAALGKHNLLPSHWPREPWGQDRGVTALKQNICYLLCASLQHYLQFCLQAHGPDESRTWVFPLVVVRVDLFLDILCWQPVPDSILFRLPSGQQVWTTKSHRLSLRNHPLSGWSKGCNFSSQALSQEQDLPLAQQAVLCKCCLWRQRMTEERQKMRQKAAKAASWVEADPTLHLKQGWDTNKLKSCSPDIHNVPLV